MPRTARASILFLAANPSATSRLALDEEVRAIQGRLRHSGAEGRVELRAEWALRADELPAALMRHRPRVVHFSGHGSADGELLLSSGDAGDVKPLSAETLRRIFEPLIKDLCCVVLNACYSTVQAKALVEIVPCVIGMRSTVKDAAAQAFSAGFYEALSFGESVQTAFKLGGAQIEIAEQSEQRDIPQLLLRPGTDAATLRPFPVDTTAPSRKATIASGMLPTLSFRPWMWIATLAAVALLAGAVGFTWRRIANRDRRPARPAAFEMKSPRSSNPTRP